MKLNRKYFSGIAIFLAAATLAACSNNKNSRRTTSPTPSTRTQPQIPPGGLQHQTGPYDQSRHNPHESRSDDIVFPAGKDNVMYDPTNVAHIVNPNAKPILTGYSSSDYLDYTDAGNDNIMENLRRRLDSAKLADNDIVKKSLEKEGLSKEDPRLADNDLRQKNIELARAITQASLHRREGDYIATMKISVEGQDLKFTADLNDTENESKRKVFKMETEDTSDFDATLSCVAKSTRDACSVAVARLTRKNEAYNQAYVVFRKYAADIYLGEYTSRLVYQPQNDPVVDRWHQFFRHLDFQQLYATSQGGTPVAELRTFAVVNGRAGFDFKMNRDEFAPFVLSGELVTNKRSPSTKVNSPLHKDASDDNHDHNHEDIIETTVHSASLVHNNGRGMLQIGLQLIGFGEGPATENGGLHFDEKTKRKLQQQDRRFRHTQTNRNKSSRLQEKSNRALRITIVPILALGIDDSLVQK